jgi:hypothetical protein
MAVENDIVLIYFENQPLLFARIEEILPDVKPNWYCVKLLMLKVPLQVVTWILRDAYINGDTFTMDGKKMRLELVESPVAPKTVDTDKPISSQKQKYSKTKVKKVISLVDLKKQ